MLKSAEGVGTRWVCKTVGSEGKSVKRLGWLLFAGAELAGGRCSENRDHGFF